MPFTATIAGFINSQLKAGCSLLTDGQFYGIASVIARKKSDGSLEQLPGVLDSSTGNYTAVWPDDNYRLMAYHKIISNAYSYDRKNSYGDGYHVNSATEMQLIVWGDSAKLGIAEELESVLVFGLPQKLSNALMLALGLQVCNITPTGSVLDRLTVFRQEYPQSTFFLKPIHQFFLIRYRIECSFNRACVADLCGGA